MGDIKRRFMDFIYETVHRLKGDLVATDRVTYGQVKHLLETFPDDIDHGGVYRNYASGVSAGPGRNKNMEDIVKHLPPRGYDRPASLDFVQDKENNHLYLRSRTSTKGFRGTSDYHISIDLGPIAPEDVEEYVQGLYERANMPQEDIREAYQEELQDEEESPAAGDDMRELYQKGDNVEPSEESETGQEYEKERE